MEKSQLAIAALVAAIIGILIGVFAYMQGNKASREAAQARAVAADAAPSEEQIAAQARKAVSAELERTREEVRKLVEGVEERIKALEKQATRVDILAEAKRVATANAEQSSNELFRQVRDLRKEFHAGDVEAVKELKKIKADLDKKLDATRATLNRKVDRWIESGVM